MKIESQVLIEDLIERTRTAMNEVQRYQSYSNEQLNWKGNKDQWSILECLEHLNRYGRFYLPEIKRCISVSPKNATPKLFKSGWLGNYFAKSMLPKEQLNKINTFKSMNPSGSQLTRETISEFLDQLRQLLSLLDAARQVDMTKTKTSVSISKWIKLRLGDTFRVVIYHIQRHLVQMGRVAEQQGIRV